MKPRMVTGFLALLFLVVGGGGSLASQSPIDSPLSTSYPTIVINGTRLSTRTPTGTLSAMLSATAIPTATGNIHFPKGISLTTPSPAARISKVNSYSYACLMAARWWGFSESLCD